MNIILCGYNWSGCKALKILCGMGHNIFVYTHKSPYYIPSLEDYCKELDIDYSLQNISDSVLPFIPDVIASIYYRYIIDEKIINTCNKKIFNLHPSLLPKYRGCSSLAWAYINGDNEVGYTYHYVNKGIDTGKVILQKKIPLESFDNGSTLYNKIMFYALEDFGEVLKLVSEGFPGYNQIGKTSYHKRGCPYNGEIKETWDDNKINRFIKTMIFPPMKPATYKGEKIYNINEFKKIRNDMK